MIIRISLIILGWQACCSAGREATEGGAGTVECNVAVKNCSCRDNTSYCYPKLAEFLEEFTNHYTHSEVYFLLLDDGKFGGREGAIFFHKLKKIISLFFPLFAYICVILTKIKTLKI